jgi:ribonucleoside-diphosphate reductase alpha chain
MRNSNCVAIAPTATISNIIGVSACIEPTFQNLYVKSNLSGEFTIVNDYLVRDLKERGLWDEVMVSDLKYFDGALSRIDRIPADLRAIYATAFEVDPRWLVEAASRRQKWIDQAQSLNIYMAGASGKKLDEVYKLAWLRGLKTTYYLRTIGATHVEKSTVAHGALNAVPSGDAGHDGSGGGMGGGGVAGGVPGAGAPGVSGGMFATAGAVTQSNAMATTVATSAADEDIAGPVCMMRPGDPGFEECEACQ